MSDYRYLTSKLDCLSSWKANRVQRAMAPNASYLDRLWAQPQTADPRLDPWQADIIKQIVRARNDILVNCSSQSGKTWTVALGAYLLACYGLHVLIVSPGDRQSMEFHSALMAHHERLGLVSPKERPTKHGLKLTSGGKVIACPNSPDKIRGISAVDAVVVDEASRVSEELYKAVSRMLATTQGQQIWLSTPNGKRGFFWEQWDKGIGWKKHEVPWQQCSRIDPEYIDKQRAIYGDLYIQQEFECVFLDDNTSVFRRAKYEALFDPELECITDW